MASFRGWIAAVAAVATGCALGVPFAPGAARGAEEAGAPPTRRGDEPDLREISPRRPVSAPLAPGERHAYSLRGKAGQYLRIEARQRGVDLEVRLLDPAGARVAKADDLLSLFAPEVLEVVTGAGGTYWIEVEGWPGSPAGAYELTVAERRAATPADRERFGLIREAQHAFDLALGAVDGGLPPGAEREAGLAGARQQAEKAIALWRRLGSLNGEAFARNVLGSLQRRAPGGEETALASFEAALALWRRAGNPQGEAAALISLGNLNLDLGRTDEAIHLFRHSLARSREAGDFRPEVQGLIGLGVAHRRTGDVQVARTAYGDALELAAANADPQTECRAANRLGTLLRDLGEVEPALALHRQSLEACLRARDGIEEILARSNLGVALQDLGELEQARGELDRAAKRAKELGATQEQAVVALNTGILYLQLGQAEKAREEHEVAAALFGQVQNAAGESNVLTLLGYLNHLQGAEQEALAHFERAWAASRRTGSRWLEAAALHGRGVGLAAVGSVEPAREALAAALELRRRYGDRTGQAATLAELGDLLRQAGDLAGSRRHLEEALAACRGGEEPSLEANVLARLARLERAEGNLAGARASMEAALQRFESLRLRAGDPELRSTFFAFRRQHYEFLIDVLLDLAARAEGGAEREAAFAASERARARGLLDLLAEARVAVGSAADPALRSREREALVRLSAVQRRLNELQAMGEAPQPEVEELRRLLRAAREELDEVRRSIRASDPAYAELQHPEPLGLAEVRGHLGTDEALLEYTLGEERSHLFVVTREELRVYPLPPRRAVREKVEAALRLLRPGGEGEIDAYPGLAYRLFEELLGPAVPEVLERCERWVVVPDDVLFLLPFEALVAERPRTARPPAYVVRKWEVSYAPSASVLVRLGQGREAGGSGPAGRSLVAFGDPIYSSEASATVASADREAAPRPDRSAPALPRLAASREEVEGIAALYGPDGALTYLGERASEENVKANPEVSRAQHLHFAVHGVVGGPDPAAYALVLSRPQGSAEDGWLQLHEIFDLRLSADLVVLSACDTGLGARVPGEGIVGLSRAFLYAGARSLVVALWRVEDRSTAAFMPRFYGLLRQTARKGEALRRAKLQVLEANPFATPAAWAPFILQGEAL